MTRQVPASSGTDHGRQRRSGGEDVDQPLVVVATHTALASARTSPRIAGLSVAAGTTSTSTPSSTVSSLFNPAQRHHTDAIVKVDQQTDITGVGVVTPSDAAEHPHVAGTALSRNLQQSTAVPTRPPAKAGCQAVPTDDMGWESASRPLRLRTTSYLAWPPDLLDQWLHL